MLKMFLEAHGWLDKTRRISPVDTINDGAGVTSSAIHAANGGAGVGAGAGAGGSVPTDKDEDVGVVCEVISLVRLSISLTSSDFEAYDAHYQAIVEADATSKKKKKIEGKGEGQGQGQGQGISGDGGQGGGEEKVDNGRGRVRAGDDSATGGKVLDLALVRMAVPIVNTLATTLQKLGTETGVGLELEVVVGSKQEPGIMSEAGMGVRTRAFLTQKHKQTTHPFPMTTTAQLRELLLCLGNGNVGVGDTTTISGRKGSGGSGVEAEGLTGLTLTLARMQTKSNKSFQVG